LLSTFLVVHAFCISDHGNMILLTHSPTTLRLMEEKLFITPGTVSPYGDARYPSLLKYDFDYILFF